MDFLSSKKVIYAGGGDIIDFGDGYKVIFHYKAEIVDNGGRILIDDSKLQYPKGYGKPMELIFGKKFKLAVWETCLKTMRVDEVACFSLPVKEIIDFPFVSKQLRDISKKQLIGKTDHDHEHHSTCMGMVAAAGGLGYPELDDWLKNPRPLNFTFHLLNYFSPDAYERESWTLNASEKIASLADLRSRGNALFAAGDFAKACDAYCEALSRIESLQLMEKPGDDEWKKLDAEKVPFYANIAECKLRTSDFYAAIEACDEALSRDASNAKALFRRAKSHAAAWNFDASRRDFKKLAQLNATWRDLVEKQLKILETTEKSKKEEEKTQFKAIFS